MIPIIRGVDKSKICPSRFSDKFLEKRAGDVEKFFMESLKVEPIFCMFGN
jgi:hypothetical protein